MDKHTKRRYQKVWKEDPKLPRDPPDFYSDCSGWREFFGKRDPDEYFSSWEGASRVVQNELEDPPETAREYRYFRYKDHPGLPSNPARDCDDFPGWKTFLGKEESH